MRPRLSKIVDYPAWLSAAWQDHLQPRSPTAPTVVSTFSGCGGSTLGYSMAGYDERLAVDVDDHAVEIFRLNFPTIPVYHGNIADLTVDEVIGRTGLAPGLLDVLDGSPPCQGLSTSGKRNFGDSRNQLFRQFVRLLVGLQPKAFIVENVSGLVKGSMRLLFADMLTAFKAAGYAVSARLVDAAYFGVPQHRQRLIFIGTRLDVDCRPTHPTAAYAPVSAAAALQAVRNQTFCRPAANVASAIWQAIRPGDNGSRYRPGYYYGTCKVHPDRSFPTLIAVSPGSGGMMHWSDCRTLTIDEAKRAQSFPDPFRLVGSFEDQWMKIGNSVPPLLMKALAGHVRTTILDSRQKATAA